jgi:hypothetical protein
VRGRVHCLVSSLGRELVAQTECSLGHVTEEQWELRWAFVKGELKAA